MYERMKAAGYAADRVTYGTLVGACKEAGELQRVLNVHKEMQDAGLKPDQVRPPSGLPRVIVSDTESDTCCGLSLWQVVYHAVMGAYGEAGRWEESVAALQEMKRKLPVRHLAAFPQTPLVFGHLACPLFRDCVTLRVHASWQ